MRFPLYAKILALLFANLLAIAAVVLFFAQGQLRFGLEYILAGRAGERVQAVAQLVGQELNSSGRSKWEESLDRFSAAYQLDLHLVRGDGGTVLTNAVELPDPVAHRVREMQGPPQIGRPPGWQSGDPRMSDPAFRFRDGAPPEAYREPGGPPRDEMRQRTIEAQKRFGNRGSGLRAPYPRSILRTDGPRRYWVLVRLPIFDRERGTGGPLTLVIESPNLSGNGLLFDFKPWLLAGAASLVVSLLMWFPLVRGITRSVGRMTEATGRIAEGKLEARVASTRADELGTLAGSIDSMAARLEGFVGGQKRFLGDTAHELCAPIARIQMALGILEQRADETQREYVNDLREEVQHMSSLVNELLSFSKASLRQREVELQPVKLAEMARHVAEREAGDSGSVQVNIPPDLVALAEPELLSRAVANLVRNALRYAGEAGPIELSARPTEVGVSMTVADQGRGVPEDALQQIFDPFYRLDVSRNRETGGVGLGLAIVKTCVEACQAKVSARNRKPSGLEVTITLKAAPTKSTG